MTDPYGMLWFGTNRWKTRKIWINTAKRRVENEKSNKRNRSRNTPVSVLIYNKAKLSLKQFQCTWWLWNKPTTITIIIEYFFTFFLCVRKKNQVEFFFGWIRKNYDYHKIGQYAHIIDCLTLASTLWICSLALYTKFVGFVCVWSNISIDKLTASKY